MGGGCSGCDRKIREKNIKWLTIHLFLQDEIKEVLRYYLSFILSKKLKMWRYI